MTAADARELRRAISIFVIVAVSLRVLRALGLPPVSRYIVEGSSMEPAFHTGDRILINRRAYRNQIPRVGDVVVLHDPERRGHVLLKRVAATPDGNLDDPSLVYVLGDNTAESRDSRSFGRVAREAIIGRAWLRY